MIRATITGCVTCLAALATFLFISGIFSCTSEAAPITVINEEVIDTVWVLSFGDGGSGICGVCTADTTVAFVVQSLEECNSIAHDRFDTTSCAYASFNRM